MPKVENFFGCRLLRDGQLVKQGLWVRGGVIIDPAEVNYVADVSVDCCGAIIAPGFIDLKLNGALGVDFSEPKTVTEEAVRRIQQWLPSTGVTMFCPTIRSQPVESYRELLAKLHKESPDAATGAGIAGVHLSGPFFAIPGYHDSHLVRKEIPLKEGSAVEALEEVYGDELENLAMVSLAPELPGAMEAIETLRRWGVAVGLGHTKAPIGKAEEAVRRGAKMISGLFNAMPSFHHRDPGVIGLLTSTNPAVADLKFTIVADRNRMHRAALRMAYRAAPQALTLVTDGVAALGLEDGKHRVGDIEMEKTTDEYGDPVCYRTGREGGCAAELYGSVCPFNVAIRHLVELADSSLAFALEAASTRPAQILGIYPQKGSLEFGADADFTILRPDTLEVCATFIRGHKVADSNLIPDLSLFTDLGSGSGTASPGVRSPIRQRRRVDMTGFEQKGNLLTPTAKK